MTTADLYLLLFAGWLGIALYAFAPSISRAASRIVNQARANAATRRQVRAIEWHAAQARHPSSTPTFDQLARERMAADLADDGAIERWLA
jgi:hypothetical protein